VVRLNIYENRAKLIPEESVGCRHESKRRGDNLTRQAQALKRDLKRKHAVVEQA
jgi:hypothetical protein